MHDDKYSLHEPFHHFGSSSPPTMNYKSAAIVAREVVRQSHTPRFTVPKSRSRILGLYRQIMRLTSTLTTDDTASPPTTRQLPSQNLRDRFRFAVWNAFHKNRYISSLENIDILEFQARYYLLEPVKSISTTTSVSRNSLQAQQHFRNLLRELYTKDLFMDFLMDSQGLNYHSKLLHDTLNDTRLETSSSLQFVRRWNAFLASDPTPVVGSFEEHKQLVKSLENETSMLAKAVQLMTFYKSKGLASRETAKSFVHIKDVRLTIPRYGGTHFTKESSMWTNRWRRTFAKLPPVVDMPTLEHLVYEASHNDRFVATRYQHLLKEIIGVEESAEGQLVCAVHKPQSQKKITKDDVILSSLKGPRNLVKQSTKKRSL